MLQIVKEKNDFYTSVERALTEIDPNWASYDGVVIVGSHSPENIQQKLDLLRITRENKIPTLGICLGMQLMAVEFSKNVLGIKDATSQEFGPGVWVVEKMKDLRVGIFDVGKQKESHWHHFKVGEKFADLFKVQFETQMTDNVLESMRLKNHPFFCGVQYHPEYQSSKDKPHPLLVEFIKTCKKSNSNNQKA